MGLHQLAHQLDVRRVSQLHQHDRQIPGDTEAPQVLLTERVRRAIGRAAARRVGSKHTRREAVEEHRMLIIETKMLERAVDVRERHREGARGGAPVAILPGKRQRDGPIRRYTSGECDARLPP